MSDMKLLQGRRRFLGGLGATALGASAMRLFETGVFAEELTRARTPSLTEGPYYPDHLPLDTDNDLLIVNNQITPAVGAVTHLSGRIVDKSGNPVRNALVEIWQVDNFGSYIHSHGLNRESGKHDTNFQGYGRFLTASTGEYYFRTIKPVAYPGRTPHIHVKVRIKGKEVLTTQFFIKGDKRNAWDDIFGELSNAQQALVAADFAPISASKAGELSARLDIVLGMTPQDDHA